MNQLPALNADSKTAKHVYEVEATLYGVGDVETVKVHASDRAQAARIAKEHGYTVRSVNMVG